MGRGSTGNVIAALASFCLPGLGQLIQGRLLAAAGYLLLSGVIWAVSFGTLGVLGHTVAALEAAVWTEKARRTSR